LVERRKRETKTKIKGNWKERNGVKEAKQEKMYT
jgi:hypothetical protein